MIPSRILERDPELDLVLEREIEVPLSVVWKAWTKPEQVRQWFAPVPWTIPECVIDLRAGGIFRCVMRSPEGKEYPNVACYLEVVPNERLVWTDALLPGFRPSSDPLYTASLVLGSRGDATSYAVTVMHADAATRQRHVDAGFEAAWGTALDQLAAHIGRG